MDTKILNESLKYKEMVGMIKPTVHIDEFVSKIGDDADYMVLSFYVKSELAADDLINWFENGYDFIMDADKSPGEIKPNRYLVYTEIKRRTRSIEQIEELISDLETLTEFKLDDWSVKFKNNIVKYDFDTLNDLLILSPRKWRQVHENELNEMRLAAGVSIPISTKEKNKDLDTIREQAGLI